MVKGLADAEGKSLIVEIRFSGAWLIEPPEATPERLAEGSLCAQCPSCLWSHFRTVGWSVCLPLSHTFCSWGSPLEDKARLPLYFCGQKPLRSGLMEQKLLYKDKCGLVGICAKKKKKSFKKHFCNGTNVTAHIVPTWAL